MHIRILNEVPKAGIRRFSMVRKSRNVVTLDPTRMVELRQPRLEPRDVKNFFVKFPLLLRIKPLKTSFGDPITLTHGSVQSFIFYKAQAAEPESTSLQQHLDFPPTANGYLYFHKSTPEISSAIRFRVATNSSPFSFEAGHDLLLPPTDYGEELAWEIPLLSIATSSTYRPFLQTILDEDLADRTLIERLWSLGHGQKVRLSRLRKILYTIDQPFVVDLSRKVKLNFISSTGYVGPIEFAFFAWRESAGGPRQFPYSGKVRVRFVLSPLREHHKNPSLLLQYLEILTPITTHLEEKRDFIGMPVVGEYLRRKGKLWTYPLKDETRNRRKIAEVFDIPL
ncbi:hypothetical protein CPC08DRAFT_709262 [Agrocybe pediades]|nr:hypothetical protein CPC08DRAFT_709262 [Agrocybe pediades]